MTVIPFAPTQHRRRPSTIRAKGLRASQYVAMVVTLICILAPFLWLVISSVSSQADLITIPLQWVPQHPTMSRLAALTFGSTTDNSALGFRAALGNSIVVVSATTAIAMVTGVIAAYAFATLHFPGRDRLVFVFLATYMLPPIAIILPVYEFLSGFGLLDTRIALKQQACRDCGDVEGQRADHAAQGRSSRHLRPPGQEFVLHSWPEQGSCARSARTATGTSCARTSTSSRRRSGSRRA